MRRHLLVLPLLLVSGWVHAQAGDCGALVKPQSMPVQPTLLPSLAPELAIPSHQLGAPTGVLSQAFDEAQSVDHVLFRLRVEGCRSVANALPAPSPATGVIDPASYKPRTEFDNTPWRFNMSQNGKNMTADEFSAWMKARGVRVARGAATPAAAPVAAPGDLPDPPPTPAAPMVPTSQPDPMAVPPAPTITPPATTPPPAQPQGMPPGYQPPAEPPEGGADASDGG
jgi:hypothetical protein